MRVRVWCCWLAVLVVGPCCCCLLLLLLAILLSCSRRVQDCKAHTPAPGKLKEFGAYLAAEGAARQDVQQLKQEVHAFASGFAMPGGDW